MKTMFRNLLSIMLKKKFTITSHNDRHHIPIQFNQLPMNNLSIYKHIIEKNPIINRCMQLIAENLACIPIKLYAKDNSDVPEHCAIDLIRNPNSCQNQGSFFEQIAYNLMIHDEAIIEIQSHQHDIQLIILDIKKMNVIYDEYAFPQEYTYSSNNNIRTIEKHRICHISNANPIRKKGSGILDVVTQAATIYHEVTEHNIQYLRNSIKPSGALIFKGNSQLTEEQRQKLRNEVDVFFRKKPGEVMILQGDFHWEPMSSIKMDFNYQDAINASYKMIATAFGVPVQLLGIDGMTYSNNYKEAKSGFQKYTLVPMLSKIIDCFNHKICEQFYNGEVRYKIDQEKIQ